VLIGKALDLIPHCVAVVEAMGRIGIGPDGGAFRLDHLASIDASGAAKGVYCPPWPSLDAEQQAITAAQIMASNTPENTDSVTLQFLTPLRAKFQNRLAGLPDFPLFFGSLLRRLMDLARLYQEEPLEVDYHGLMERARQVTFIPGPLTWCDWERYSNRQGQRMKLGGVMGTVTYQGDLTEFLPYLALGEWLHVGKGATFGLGMYRVVGETAR
jgi:CRISPR-associated endoribonuclease Cas6